MLLIEKAMYYNCRVHLLDKKKRVSLEKVV